MRHVLFFTLAFYGFTAMDMHEWVRLPQVVMHLLEHHGGFGHHDDTTGHAGDHSHNPFGHDQHEACGATSLVSLPADQPDLALIVPVSIAVHVTSEMAAALSDFSGSKWNPPKG